MPLLQGCKIYPSLFCVINQGHALLEDGFSACFAIAHFFVEVTELLFLLDGIQLPVAGFGVEGFRQLDRLLPIAIALVTGQDAHLGYPPQGAVLPDDTDKADRSIPQSDEIVVVVGLLHPIDGFGEGLCAGVGVVIPILVQQLGKGADLYAMERFAVLDRSFL